MATANSGHKSRTSSTNGRRLRSAISHADSVWKIGGVVPRTKSMPFTCNDAYREVGIKLQNDTTRQIKLRCREGYVYARSMRTPSRYCSVTSRLWAKDGRPVM